MDATTSPVSPAVAYRVAHTADLGPPVLAAARAVFDVAFDGDISEDDWDHSLGGVHVVAVGEGEVVGHAAVVQRRLLTGGRARRAGYVEGVAVHPDWRRAGVASEMMARLERIVHAAYELGALGSSDMGAPFYAGRGWIPWRGPLSALTPSGIVPTPEERGGVFVLPGTVPLDLDAELTCDWRDGDVW